MKTIKADELKGRELEVLEDGTLRLIETKVEKFIPSVGEEYWYLNCGEVVFSENNDVYSDKWIMDHQLVFKTKEECEEYRSFLDLLDEYKCDLDWEDQGELKYYLYYDYLSECLNVGDNSFARTQGAFYFKSKIDAQEFIEKAGKENIKRFMFDIWE